MSLLRGNHGVFRSGKTAGSFLLDQVGVAASAAYSVRKLRSGYSGNCIRVRRSSDNAEMNIGFSGNDLDTATLLSFVGGGNGFVTTWYDQSPSGLDATQTTGSSQPQIVTSSSLITQNGKPAIQFFSTGNTRLTFSGVSSSTDFSSFCVLRKVGAGDRICPLGNTSSLIPFSNYTYHDQSVYISNSTQYRQFLAGAVTTQTQYSHFNASSVQSLYEKGSLKTLLNAVNQTGATTFNVVGNRNGESTVGFIQEILYFNSSLLNSRVLVETNINQYFQIY